MRLAEGNNGVGHGPPGNDRASPTTPPNVIHGYHGAVEINGKIYAVGGIGNGGFINVVEFVSPNNDGTLGSWTIDSPLNLAGRGSGKGVAEFDGNIYAVSARDIIAQPNPTNFVEYASVVVLDHFQCYTTKIAERIRDVVSTGEKVVVFTCFNDGVKRHKSKLNDAAVTITGSCSAQERMNAVDRFQTDPDIRVALCNIIAGGVGITLTAGTHVIFQDLDWVPANHAQAEDRCYRMGQTKPVTVEYFHAAGSLDGYIAELLSKKMELIAAVEADQVPDSSILADLEAGLRRLAPALMEEARLARETGDAAEQVEALAAVRPRSERAETPLEETGSWEFTSERDASQTYQVTYGRAGHLECSCKGFQYRGNCKHVRQVREMTAA